MCVTFDTAPHHSFFFKDFIYLFLEKGEGRVKERERSINMWMPVTCSPLGAGPQPRHVPWLGIEPATLWFAGQCSIHWAAPARALFSFSTCAKYDLDFSFPFAHRSMVMNKVVFAEGQWEPRYYTSTSSYMTPGRTQMVLVFLYLLWL